MGRKTDKSPPQSPLGSLSLDVLMGEARRRQPALIDLLRRMVEIESPSDDKAAVNRCAGLVEEACAKAGGKVRRHRQARFGDLLEVRFAQSPGQANPGKANPGEANRGKANRPLLLLGHLDTVWPLGTLTAMPFRVRAGRIQGPGVLDMKAGVAMALTAIEMLRDRELLPRPVVLLLNSDEEVGSPSSRQTTERLARRSEAVFVLEPAQGLNGAYKTARKGVGDFTLSVSGVAAHSGIDFERGHSAIAELARQIQRIETFTDLARGLTFNPGVIAGGTRSNVVAGRAWAQFDVRIARAADGARIERRMRALRPFDKDCRIEIRGGINRPPMERSAATVALFKEAAKLALGLGISLQESATGGGSDGNFTAALGIPTLDGMGAVGEGAHAPHEYILVEHLAPRTALLAAMIANPALERLSRNRKRQPTA